jgi:serine/threonine-protein kinase
MAEQLNGKYVIEGEGPLGRGGMAEVFAGRTIGVEGFSHPVAIKRIHSEYSADPEFRSMFVAEARLTARLSHSNIVGVHDFDQDESGRLFLVMELVDGIDLEGLRQTGALPLPVVLFVVSEILRGLGHAHDLPICDGAVRGLVHRDVSPQNVLIGWDGAVKVSDFGIAKARAATKVSASFFLKGKVAYMSPEQVNGHALDGRSDLFSVGVMLWEMLCHARLFARDGMEATLKRVLFDPVPSPRSRRPDLPRDVERITLWLLEKDREHRYRDAGTALAALAACAAYPKNGRELLSALLRERLPERSRQRSAGGARRLPAARAAWEETATLSSVVPVLDRTDPFRIAPRRSRARRMVPLAVLGVATALTASFAVGSSPHTKGGGDPSPPAASVAPPMVHQQPSEARASSVTNAPPIPVPPVPLPSPNPARIAPAPTAAAPAPARSAIRRAPATGPQPHPASPPEPTNRERIRVIDLSSPQN